jgi:hypothetical protein
MPRKQPADHAAALEKAFVRWDDIRENGCNDPFWPDGVNLNLVRNHIIHHRMQLEETPTLFGFPEIYNREVPPEVDPMYVARADEIRAAARASLEAYRADPGYQFILARRDEIPPKAREKMLAGYALNTVAGLERAIAEDILVSMRRHEQPDSALATFESCAGQIRDFLSGGMDSVAGPTLDELEDEGFEEELDEDYGEDFDDEAEQEFGGMTMM